MRGCHAANQFTLFSKSGALEARSTRVPFTSANPRWGGGDRIRTDDRLVANQVLYQLSYAPAIPSQDEDWLEMVGLSGVEPLTSRLSGGRSNH